MKKIYLALLLVLPFISKAQPTITMADLPVIGITYIMGTDPAFAGPVPTTGPMQTWDYSNLLYLDYDTTAFIDPSMTPYYIDHFMSNVSSYDPTSDAYAYYTNTTDGFYLDAIQDPYRNTNFFPPQLFVPVPFTFGDTRPTYSTTQFDTAITDTMGTTIYRFVYRIGSFHKANGYGTLTTPNGTYTDVLAINITDTVYDSVYVDIGGGNFLPLFGSMNQSVSYRFFTTGLTANYIMGMELDSTGTVPISSEFLVDHPLGIEKVTESKKAIAYPNPASQNINFKYMTENSKIIIYDSGGKEVYRSVNSGLKNINVQTLENGIYHYELNNSGKVQKGSFVVQH